MITAIIIENEKKAIELLSKLLEKHFPEVELLSICENIPDGVKQVNKINPDLLFLDVELPPYSGFDLLDQTRNLKYKVIFTTSYNKYAVRAIKFCALSYLKKPFGYEELKEAIDRYKEQADEHIQRKQINALLDNLRQGDFQFQKFCVPVKNGVEAIEISELIMCQGQDGGIAFYMKDNQRNFSISKSLKWAEEILFDKGFFRTHDSFLINLRHFKGWRHVKEGAEVNLTNDYKAEVSKSRKGPFLAMLDKLNNGKG